MPYGIIYKITNTKNGMAYIGQTTLGLRARWRLHQSSGSTCSYLKQAIVDSGADAFTIAQIDSGESRQELNEKERKWIEQENTLYPNGYNSDKRGYHVNYTEASRRKMSEHHSDVSGEKNPLYGTHHSAETRRLISEALTGKYAGKNSAYHKAVVNLDTGEKYDTATDAARAYGVTVSTLTKTCRGAQKRTAGYRWAFDEGVIK